MKNNKSMLALILVMVLAIGGAYVVYGKLSQNAAPDALVVMGAQAEEGKTDFPATESESIEADATEADATKSENTEQPALPLAPDFTVYDKDGNAVMLSSFFGKPIVMNFWASWCPPCRMEMPDFNEKYLELGDKVHFLMINMTAGRETKAEAEKFINEENFSFPIYFDIDQDAAMTYGAYSLPTTYFIGKNGEAIAQATGAIDADTLQRGIDMIMP